MKNLRGELRIISLLPAATEMVYLLGLSKNLVGISDDSDFPQEVSNLPRVVTTKLSKNLTSRQIDQKMRSYQHKGISAFHVDKNMIRKLVPNLVLSQELCEVCAIGSSVFEKATRLIKHDYELLSLEPESVGDVMDNIKMIGSLTHKEEEATGLVRQLEKRIRFIIHNSRFIIQKPKVLILEWIDPLMVAGHWVPEMVEAAGGINLISKKKDVSKRIVWEDVIKADPDVLIIAPCGFKIDKTLREIRIIRGFREWNKLKAVENSEVYLVDGDAYLARPGPRLVDGVEILAEIMHPQVLTRRFGENDWRKFQFRP